MLTKAKTRNEKRVSDGGAIGHFAMTARGGLTLDVFRWKLHE